MSTSVAFDQDWGQTSADLLLAERLRIAPDEPGLVPGGRGWAPASRQMAELCSDCPDTIGDVLKMLTRTQAIMNELPPPAANRVASFNSLYFTITDRVRQAIRGNDVTDADFMELFNVEFAKRYFEALRLWGEEDLRTPDAWEILFRRAQDRKVSKLAAAMLGVNAQLNHDFALSLISTWEQLGAPRDEVVHPDYLLVNKIFYQEIPRLRRRYSTRLQLRIDGLLDDLDDWSQRVLVAATRAHAWDQARRLWQLRSDEEDFARARLVMDRAAAYVGELLLAEDGVAKRVGSVLRDTARGRFGRLLIRNRVAGAPHSPGKGASDGQQPEQTSPPGASGDVVPGSAGSGSTPPPSDNSAPVPSPNPQRLLVGHLPSRAPVGAEVSLTVRIVRNIDVHDTRATAMRPMTIGAGGVDVTILVQTGVGLDVLGPLQQRLHVPADADSDPIRFAFRTTSAALHRTHVTAWLGGTFLAELDFEISVSEGGRESETEPKVAEISSMRQRSGEVTLQVRYDQGRYTFQLLSDIYLSDPILVESISAGPDAATEQAISTLRKLARQDTSYTSENVRRWLQNAGVALWLNLVPEDVREQFWQLRSRITTFSIATGLDTVPWELLYPMAKGQDEGFLVEQFPVTRRVYNQNRAQHINIGGARFVVPPDGPRNATAEAGAVNRIVSRTEEPSIITSLSELLDLIEAGETGLTHFSCHNTYRLDGSGSSITMDDGDLVPMLLEKAKAQSSLAATKPLVFINACRSAGSVPHYTQMMGWAQQFLGAGAGAFVGTLWDVNSASAQVFAESFYHHLMAGQTLGQAALQARITTRRDDIDPTWLAYTIYGDPNASAIHR